jgi:hypothetical protein
LKSYKNTIGKVRVFPKEECEKVKVNGVRKACMSIIIN